MEAAGSCAAGGRQRLGAAAGGARAADSDFDLHSFLANVLAEDLQPAQERQQQQHGSAAATAGGDVPPFLVGRALWMAARCPFPSCYSLCR